ncbi:hypothetical protein RRG08_038912 [Elysia crispata]|uniref:Uncharacterized protein n=1 Tax=Elysia crispata TaxID=231223 RepID=A0AAE1CTR2_9GAST|nr:hypothetical protein RRG08_038912 [Elysia crispata]
MFIKRALSSGLRHKARSDPCGSVMLMPAYLYCTGQGVAEKINLNDIYRSTIDFVSSKHHVPHKFHLQSGLTLIEDDTCDYASQIRSHGPVRSSVSVHVLRCAGASNARLNSANNRVRR